MATAPLPALIAHCDWSTDPRKQWMAVGRLNGDTYELSAPEPVADVSTLLDRLTRRGDGGTVLVGFDFPIGLPATYAERAGIVSFVDALRHFGSGDWARFYEPVADVADISLHRPFYPRNPGGRSQAQLTQALGVAGISELRRACEQATPTRSAACPLFWTLGGNQVGRAAITGWRDLLAPTLRDRETEIAFWPFQSDLETLLLNYRIVIAETYPAEACSHIGLPRPGSGWSKRRQADRIAQSARIQFWADRRKVNLSPQLTQALANGFSSRPEGEDQFDAVVGLASMIEVVTGHRAAGAPDVPEIRAIEGWILGQAADPAPHATPSLWFAEESPA